MRLNMFNAKWFQKHQGLLLWFANNLLGRYVFRVYSKRSSVGKNKIIRILPNSITWQAEGKYHTEFRAHNKFSKRIHSAFYPLWWLMHQWDTLFANSLMPNLNLGFDSLTAYPDPDVEVSTVDGNVKRSGVDEVFGTIRAGAGSVADDSSASVTMVAAN